MSYCLLRTLILIGGGLLMAAGCIHQNTMDASPELPPVAGPVTEQVMELGRSVQGRPIMLHTFNAGPRPVLIFAAIHGDEGTTAYCVDRLLEVLRTTPSLMHGTPVAIIPVANPDGLAAHTRQNAHAVDLNRNFPAANWKASTPHTHYYGGSAPLTEPESRLLHDLIERLQPRRICSIHSIGQGRQQNNYDGPAKPLADLMATQNHYPSSPNIGYDTFGSFGAWAGIDRQIPLITLELPNRMPGPQAWADNRAALLAFILGR